MKESPITWAPYVGYYDTMHIKGEEMSDSHLLMVVPHNDLVQLFGLKAKYHREERAKCVTRLKKLLMEREAKRAEREARREETLAQIREKIEEEDEQEVLLSKSSNYSSSYSNSSDPIVGLRSQSEDRKSTRLNSSH